MTSVESSQDTVYASKYTYDTETYAVKNNINLETESGQKQIRKYYSRIEDFPSNLNYLDSFYDSAYQFYDKIAEKYGSTDLTLTGHSLGGNVAQRVALEKNAKNTIVYNAAPLYIPAASAGLITHNPMLALAIAVGSSDSVKDIKNDRKTFTGKVTRLRTEWDPLNHASNIAGGVYIGDDYVIANSGGHSQKNSAII